MLYLNHLLQLTASPSPILWTQLITTLVVGLLTAFGFQLLLANLGIVIGLSAVGQQLFKSKEKPQTLAETDLTPDKSSQSEAIAARSTGLNAKPIGFGLLITINLVLFAACFLGTRFGQLSDPMRGAIAGLTIWSAYWIVLTWVSTRTLSSVAGFVFDGATGGIRWVWQAIATLFRNDDAEPISEDEMIARIRGEIEAALSSPDMQQILEAQLQPILTASITQQDGDLANQDSHWEQATVWQPIKAYLTETNPQDLTSKQIYQALKQQLQSIEDEQFTTRGLPVFQPNVVQGWLLQRDDLSEKKQQRILTALEKAWVKLEAKYPSQSNSDVANSIDTEKSAADTSPRESESLLQKGLKSVLEQTVDYTLGQLNLPELFHRSNVSVTRGLGLALVELAKALPQQITSKALKDSMPITIAEIKPSLEQLVEETQTQLTNFGQASLEQTQAFREMAIQPFEKAQNQIQTQVDALKRQAMEQAEFAQRTAVKGLWWLFAIAFTAAISSALAGVLATQTL